MNIKLMKGFLELSKTLNYSKTAKQMYMSQPAFSRMIESMEIEIVVKLILRDKVHPKLTPAGQNVLRHCERILNEYNELMQDAKRFSAERKKLTVGILEDGIRAGNTGRMIRQFAEENPDVENDNRNTSESAAFNPIHERELD